MRNGQWWKDHSHGSLRGAKGIDSDRFHNSGEKLDHSGLRCGQLDYINETDNHSTRSEVLLISRREATQYDNTPPGIETAMVVNWPFANDRM